MDAECFMPLGRYLLKIENMNNFEKNCTKNAVDTSHFFVTKINSKVHFTCTLQTMYEYKLM
jgi:hypothetical protein